ncbi:hypothetical protein B0H14DRAFT_3128133 [Mycena olivaceomarginata]|nr:hypothetical protein B0H14DRAFT_3128133 [Mycena olivaceomarginata]
MCEREIGWLVNRMVMSVRAVVGGHGGEGEDAEKGEVEDGAVGECEHPRLPAPELDKRDGGVADSGHRKATGEPKRATKMVADEKIEIENITKKKTHIIPQIIYLPLPPHPHQLRLPEILLVNVARRGNVVVCRVEIAAAEAFRGMEALG